MDQKEQILHYHRVDGLSLREISRRVGLNRKTVTRYIREYEASIREDPEEGLDLCLASRPKYPKRNIECTRMTEPVCAEIEYWLQENAKRRQTGMRKQCLKKQDIHRVLIEKGFNISYSSVCKYIQRRKAEKSRKPKDVFVKQYYEPGRECEFDWGEVKLRIAAGPSFWQISLQRARKTDKTQTPSEPNLDLISSSFDFFSDRMYSNISMYFSFICLELHFISYQFYFRMFHILNSHLYFFSLKQSFFICLFVPLPPEQ